MKRLLLGLSLICMFAGSTNAQKVYGEIMRMSKTVANDKSKNLQTRKIATFKQDALTYMAMKARELMPDSTSRMLDVQALAMYEYVDLFMKHLTMEKKKKDQEAVIDLFSQVTIEHPRYYDLDKDVTLSYYNNKGFLTRFSLDTDWVVALNDIKRILVELKKF